MKLLITGGCGFLSIVILEILMICNEQIKTRDQCIEKPNGFDVQAHLEFHSPYGVSKNSANQYVSEWVSRY